MTAVEGESLFARYGVNVTALALVFVPLQSFTGVCAKACMQHKSTIAKRVLIGSNLIKHIVLAEYSFASIDCGERYATESV